MQKRNTPFKSPNKAGSRIPGSVTKVSVEDLQKKLDEVNREIQELKAKGYREEELNMHIDKMHEYNDLKDIGQMVLGQLATVRGVRTQDLYGEYGLELDD